MDVEESQEPVEDGKKKKKKAVADFNLLCVAMLTLFSFGTVCVTPIDVNTRPQDLSKNLWSTTPPPAAPHQSPPIYIFF